ncbi:hypothetical protein AAG570_010175 [Ranatra chinensis]|uniref:Uncharacterized protein n=1 Tax=Ranatra chinensis TaxID=642074 RepID=A0ABD0Z7X8_9HEMI
MPPLQVSDQTKTQGIDLNKLQQAILAGYNKHLAQSCRYFLQQQQQQTYVPPQHSPYVPQHQYRPAYYQPPAFNNLFYPQQTTYQQPPYVPNPYYQQQPPFQQYPFQAPMDLDVRGQLETLATKMSGRIRNVTCIMQELGYLDHNLEPDYARMIERIGRLPVNDELKRDMTDGVNFCKQFSQCLPDDGRDKVVSEMVRPMFFFRCYKHKKLEACIMKDVRDRYTPTDEFNEDNISGNENRVGKEFPEDNMNTALYEFIYGDDSADVSNIM